MSAMDNAEFRLALFPPSDGAVERPYLKMQEIYRADGFQIQCTGQRLTQSDLNVYLRIVELAGGNFNGEAWFSVDAMLQAVGRHPGQVEWLHNTIIRLRGAVVEVRHGNRSYAGGLLKDGIFDKATGVYSLSIDMKLAHFVVSGIWPEQGPAPKSAVYGPLN